MEEKKVLLFSRRLPQRGKTKAFWEDTLKDIDYCESAFVERPEKASRPGNLPFYALFIFFRIVIIVMETG